jgi:hypothetical protein
MENKIKYFLYLLRENKYLNSYKKIKLFIWAMNNLHLIDYIIEYFEYYQKRYNIIMGIMKSDYENFLKFYDGKFKVFLNNKKKYLKIKYKIKLIRDQERKEENNLDLDKLLEKI